MSGQSQPPLRIAIEAELGRGGYSSVKLARNVDTMEPCAAKVIELDSNGKLLFRRETSILRLLPEHRGLPKLLGISRNAEATHGYIVLEYLPFPSLRAYLAQRGKLGEEEAVDVLKQLLDAVAILTESGVAHRDLKPENIIINPDNLSVKLIDFGLAQQIACGDDEAEDDSYIGTPILMAPEVAANSGDSYSVLKAECWSLGIVFLEMITGKNPFKDCKSPVELMMMQLEPIDFRTLPPVSQQICQSMLSYSAAKRSLPSEVRCLIDELSPRRQAPSGKKAWSSSRAHTFENLRTFSPIVSRARSGEKDPVLRRVIERLAADDKEVEAMAD